MTKNQFDALLATLKSKYDDNSAFVLEAYRALEEAIAHNTTGLRADELAEVKADFELIKHGKSRGDGLSQSNVPAPASVSDPHNRVVSSDPGAVLGGPSARKPVKVDEFDIDR